MAQQRKSASRAKKKSGMMNPGRGGQVLNPAHLDNIPVATVAKIRAQSPKISTVGNVVTISGREMIQSVNTTMAASYVTGIQMATPVNPGSFNLFPSLGEIASGFEQYRFTKLKFMYEGTCPTTLGGQVVLTWDPDSKDGVPVSIAEALAMPCSGVSPPYGSIVISCPPMKEPKFSDFETSADQRLINHGIVVLSTAGGAAVTSSGYLWVEYTCQLTSTQLRQTNVELLSATYGSWFNSTKIGPNYAFLESSRTIRWATQGYFHVLVRVANTTASSGSNVTFGAGVIVAVSSYATTVSGGQITTTVWSLVVNVVDSSNNATLTFPSDASLNGQLSTILVTRISRSQYNSL